MLLRSSYGSENSVARTRCLVLTLGAEGEAVAASVVMEGDDEEFERPFRRRLSVRNGSA